MSFSPTPKQAEAIQTVDRDVALIAGAGSGKTRVLVERCVHLLDIGVGLHQILAITFTRKAAQEMKDRIRKARPDLDLTDAPISTIHSFCQRVLAANPHHADVDPKFRMAEEWESRAILRETAAGVVDDAISDGDLDTLELSEDFRRIRDLVDTLVGVYEDMRAVGSTAFSVPDETHRLERRLSDTMVFLHGSLRDWLENLPEADITDAKSDQIAALKRLTAETAQDDPPFYLDQLLENLKGSWSKKLKDAVSDLKERASDAEQLLFDCQGQRRLRAVGRLLTAIHQGYSEQKKKQSLMDFDDLEIALEELLDQAGVLESLPFTHIMVDEFQDTNRRQQRIVEKLRGRPAQLFVVGDPKQSIYRFRGADVRIFAETAAAVGQRGGAVLALEDNFRSTAAIIRLVNRLFSGLMRDEAVDYYPLQSRSTISGPGVELLETAAENGGSMEEYRIQEGQQIATHIRHLVENEGVSYGDITILLRAMSPVKLYEKPLQELGIPFVNLSGRGFFTRQEVQDVLQVVYWVDDPADTAARAAVLHSPFFNLSEEALFWELQGQPEYMAESDRAIVREAEQWYQTLREMALHRPAPFFFEHLLETSDYVEAMLEGSLGSQRYANLMKLQEVSWDLWSRGQLSLFDQMHYIEQIMAETDKEGEAQLNAEEADAVKFMTIHGAKGLEFDTVFLPDLQRSLVSNQRSQIAFHHDVGLTCRQTSGHKEASALQREQELAEAKRLLYVAVTRAERRIVLCGGSDDAPAETYWDWIRDEMGESLPEFVRTVDVSPDTENRQGRPVVYVPAAPQRPPVPIVFKPTAFSTTSLAVYDQCPRRYYLRYILRAPEGALAARTGASQSQRGLDPLARGNIVHRVCERMDAFDDIDDLLVWAGSMEGVSLDADQKGEVRELAARFHDSEFFAAVREGGVRREWEFTLPIGEDWVTGIIDFAHQGRPGFRLMDLKTNAVEAEHALEEAKHYELQMRIYAWAVQTLTDTPVFRAELFFLVPNVVVPVSLDAVASTPASLLESIKHIKESSLRGVDGFPRGANCVSCGYACQEAKT